MKNQVVNIDEYRDELKKYFLELAPTTDITPLVELVNHFDFAKFRKKQIIIRAGDYSDSFNFILDGLVRIYYQKEDKEITNIFVTEHKIFAGAYSIMTGERNYSNYEAFEDTTVLQIKYEDLVSFYKKNHSLAHLGRILVEHYYTAFMKKTYDVLFLSAEERYQIFIKEQSSLLNRVPLKFIASYLGVTQETLSRLRAKY